ncbi:ran-binding protein 9-like protein [Cladochytrium replicatum]|nr:ran-binding protein 9-like protein [Cladochytrium replicatum]
MTNSNSASSRRPNQTSLLSSNIIAGPMRSNTAMNSTRSNNSPSALAQIAHPSTASSAPIRVHTQQPRIPTYLLDTPVNRCELPSAPQTLIPQSASGEYEARTERFPLPSNWNPKDRCRHLDLSRQLLRVSYDGPGHGEGDAGAIRANCPMPPQCGIYYYEVKIISKGKDGYIGVGFCDRDVSLERLPGWEKNSWGYHGDDGNSFCCKGKGEHYGPTFETDDVIGCGVNFFDMTAFYTKNGVHLGVAFRDLKGTFYPSVGLNTTGEVVEANFGRRNFVYDIDQLFKEEKSRFMSGVISRPLPAAPTKVESTTNTLLRQRVEQSINMNELVMTYLHHHGYCATAQSLVREAGGTEGGAGGPTLMQTDDLVFADKNTIVRQEIRKHVLEGNIDAAIHLMDNHFPTVLQDNEEVNFALYCRKFIEIIRVALRLNHLSSISHQNDVQERGEQMEIDDTRLDQISRHEKNSEDIVWEDVLSCGRQLQMLFGSSSKQHLRMALQEVFFLIAYKDPTESSSSHLLEISGREEVATALNSAIIGSMGGSAISSLERVTRQLLLTHEELVDRGVAAASFFNMQKDIFE